jgi:DNA-binding response OmpR family regulator
MILSAQLRDADITFLLPSLRRHHPDLPVVALTSRNSPSLEQRVRKWGVIYYLVKPLNIEELGSIISRVSIESLTA